MKKKNFLIILGSIFVVVMSGLTGCEKKQEKSSESSLEVNIAEEQRQVEISETKESSLEADETKEENSTESSTHEGENMSIKKRTALSDTGVQPPERNILPEGVAPEFMYFSYQDSDVGPYKAQEYLESIGTSIENEKLVVLWKQEKTSSLITIDVYDCTQSPIKRTSYYFCGSVSTYERVVSDLGEENIAFSDPDANFLYTNPIDMDEFSDYEYYVETLNSDNQCIVW